MRDILDLFYFLFSIATGKSNDEFLKCKSKKRIFIKATGIWASGFEEFETKKTKTQTKAFFFKSQTTVDFFFDSKITNWLCVFQYDAHVFNAFRPDFWR